MKVRIYTDNDVWKIREIHEKHYADEFELPNFHDGFLGSFVVTDDEDNIIAISGLRPLVESVVMTDKDLPAKTRVEALLQILDLSKFLAKDRGYKHLYAFVNDDLWLKHLLKMGFRPANGMATILDLT